MAADFTIKSGDRLPSIQATLSADLSTATSVDFILAPATETFQPTGDAPIVNAEAVIVSSDPEGSVVRYDWADGDTDVPQSAVAEWEVLWPSGKRETFPTLTYHSVNILADLDTDV